MQLSLTLFLICREDSSVKLALASYLADPESSLSVSYNECQSNKCAIDIALANISSRQKEQFSIGWVELSGTEEQPIKMKKTSNSFLDTISKFASGTTMDEEAIASPAQQQLRCIDAELKRLFESCPKGTTILVATQGNAREVKQLASRKLR